MTKFVILSRFCGALALGYFSHFCKICLYRRASSGYNKNIAKAKMRLYQDPKSPTQSPCVIHAAIILARRLARRTASLSATRLAPVVQTSSNNTKLISPSTCHGAHSNAPAILSSRASRSSPCWRCPSRTRHAPAHRYAPMCHKRRKARHRVKATLG